MSNLDALIQEYGSILDQERPLNDRKEILRVSITQEMERQRLRQIQSNSGSAQWNLRFKLLPRSESVLALLSSGDLFSFANFTPAKVKELLVPKYGREALIPLFDLEKTHFLMVKRPRTGTRLPADGPKVVTGGPIPPQGNGAILSLAPWGVVGRRPGGRVPGPLIGPSGTFCQGAKGTLKGVSWYVVYPQRVVSPESLGLQNLTRERNTHFSSLSIRGVLTANLVGVELPLPLKVFPGFVESHTGDRLLRGGSDIFWNIFELDCLFGHARWVVVLATALQKAQRRKDKEYAESLDQAMQGGPGCRNDCASLSVFLINNHRK